MGIGVARRSCSRRRAIAGCTALGRYYDPATAQFLSVDPLVDVTEAPYSFAGDNPLNGTDPTGLMLMGCGPDGDGACSCHDLGTCAPPTSPTSGAGSSGASNSTSQAIVTVILGGLATSIQAAGDASSGIDKRASVLGSLLRTSSDPVVRSYAAGLLRGAGTLSNDPVVKAIGRFALPVGAAVQFGGDLATGKSLGRSILETGFSAGGGVVGGTVGSFLCGTETVATFGGGSVACPFIVLGLGGAGAWAGQHIGGFIANIFDL